MPEEGTSETLGQREKGGTLIIHLSQLPWRLFPGGKGVDETIPNCCGHLMWHCESVIPCQAALTTIWYPFSLTLPKSLLKTAIDDSNSSISPTEHLSIPLNVPFTLILSHSWDGKATTQQAAWIEQIGLTTLRWSSQKRISLNPMAYQLAKKPPWKLCRPVLPHPPLDSPNSWQQPWSKDTVHIPNIVFFEVEARH